MSDSPKLCINCGDPPVHDIEHCLSVLRAARAERDAAVGLLHECADRIYGVRYVNRRELADKLRSFLATRPIAPPTPGVPTCGTCDGDGVTTSCPACIRYGEVASGAPGVPVGATAPRKENPHIGMLYLSAEWMRHANAGCEMVLRWGACKLARTPLGGTTPEPCRRCSHPTHYGVCGFMDGPLMCMCNAGHNADAEPTPEEKP